MEKKLTALTLYASGLSINKIAGISQAFPACCIKVDTKIRLLLMSKTPTQQRSSVGNAVGGDVALFTVKKINSGSERLMICMEKDWLIGNAGIVITEP